MSDTFTLNTKSLRVQIADHLRLEIISGRLRPGDRISERELSKQLNVSVTPVKEAFRTLESSGILVTLPRKGTMVSEFAKQSLEQVSILRSALEGVSANLAAKNITDEDYRHLQGLLGKVEALLENDDNIDQIESLNRQFHEGINRLSNNQYLCQLIENQWAFSQGFRIGSLKTMADRQASHREHRAILKAVYSKDSDLAERLMREHIRSSDKTALGHISRPAAENH